MSKRKVKKVIKTVKRAPLLAFIIIITVFMIIATVYNDKLSVMTGLAREVKVEPATQTIEVSAAIDGESLKIHSVDVGQGDCTIIELPDGKTMLIDGANTGYDDEIISYIQTNLPSDFKYFDYAILTHPDSDHCASMDEVLEAYPSRVFYRPNVLATRKDYVDPGAGDLKPVHGEKETVAYKNVIQAAYEETADFTPTVRVTDAGNLEYDITGDNYSYTFFTPTQDTYKDWNDYSPIMLLTYAEYNFVFTGDAEAANEAEFVAKVKAAKTDGVTDKYDVFTSDFKADVIKAGHHGSRTSSSSAYLDIMLAGGSSAYVIISCGEGNSYKHPHIEAMERFKSKGISEERIVRTDTMGSLEFSVKTEGGLSTLYFGTNSVEPTPDPSPIPTPEIEIKTVYKYTVAGMNVSFALIGWIVYAVIIIIAFVYVIVTRKKA